MAAGDLSACVLRGIEETVAILGYAKCSGCGSLDSQKRRLSRGFGPSKPLVSYQINRQLSGRNPHPLVTRAFGAHPNEPNVA